MLRHLFLSAGLLLYSVALVGQLKKFYTVKDNCSYDTVNFSLDASSGNTFIKNYAHSIQPLVIYGNPNLKRINPSFKTRFDNKTCNALLKLDTYNSYNFGDGFSFVIKRKQEEEDGDYWKVLVNDEKIYSFRMKYGVGNTEVDLSNIKTHNLWLKTGSANVKVGYQPEKRNIIPMDTFFVKVDMGSLETKNLGNARAENFVADIGFGTAILDFTGQKNHRMRCNAKIGAGSLDVRIPDKDAPVIIHMKSTPFCGITMADDFEEVEKNVYVNPSYSKDAKDLMVFDVDLAVGTISFSYAE